MAKTVKLGQVVQDSITGYEGKVTARAEYLYGCVQVLVQRQELSEDGDVYKPVWIDEPQVEVVNTEAAPEVKPRHGPRDTTGMGRVYPA